MRKWRMPNSNGNFSTANTKSYLPTVQNRILQKRRLERSRLQIFHCSGSYHSATNRNVCKTKLSRCIDCKNRPRQTWLRSETDQSSRTDIRPEFQSYRNRRLISRHVSWKRLFLHTKTVTAEYFDAEFENNGREEKVRNRIHKETLSKAFFYSYQGAAPIRSSSYSYLFDIS